MSDDFVTYLRALAEKHPWTVRSAARMRQPLDGADAQALEGALCSTERERNEAQAEVERLRAEIERLTRERDEARDALEPFSELYLWPDDAGRLDAERVRSGKDWDEAANDAESNEYGITRGDIRAARRALEAKP